MTKSFIGIDIGANGGIAIIEETGKLVFTSTIPKVKDRVDLNELNKLIKSFTERTDYNQVIIEDLHSIFGAGAKSNFNFGWINGAIEAIIVSSELSYFKVSPKAWQKISWQGIRPITNIVAAYKTDKLSGKKTANGTRDKIDTKGTSLLAVKRLFPKSDFKVTAKGNASKNDHDGIVDAVLLAYYGYRTQFPHNN